MSNIVNSKNILAFVHIEKAAGTTLMDILRRNYCLKFYEARPLSRSSGILFSSEDLQKSIRINPFIECIAGHAVKPFGDLNQEFPHIQYIALLRDPVKRYISQYQYWIERMDVNISFEEYLEIDSLKNFQTRKIAGVVDLNVAKITIKKMFLCIGIVEQFDEFVLLLKNKLIDVDLDPRYRIYNKRKRKDEPNILMEKYYDRIIDNNQIDMQLYSYIKDQVLPLEVEQYGGGFKKDLEKFKRLNSNSSPLLIKRYIYLLYKKLYIEPISGLVRRLNGLQTKGSYGIKRPGKIWDGLD